MSTHAPSIPGSSWLSPVPLFFVFLWSTGFIVAKLGLPLRSFEIPLSMERVTVMQAWHPRFHHDPAHRWLRQLLKRCCSADPER